MGGSTSLQEYIQEFKTANISKTADPIWRKLAGSLLMVKSYALLSPNAN